MLLKPVVFPACNMFLNAWLYNVCKPVLCLYVTYFTYLRQQTAYIVSFLNRNLGLATVEKLSWASVDKHCYF